MNSSMRKKGRHQHRYRRIPGGWVRCSCGRTEVSPEMEAAMAKARKNISLK